MLRRMPSPTRISYRHRTSSPITIAYVLTDPHTGLNQKVFGRHFYDHPSQIVCQQLSRHQMMTSHQTSLCT